MFSVMSVLSFRLVTRCVCVCRGVTSCNHTWTCSSLFTWSPPSAGPIQTCSLCSPFYRQAGGCPSTEMPSCFPGVITNAKKTIQTGKIVGSFAFGTKKLYDFMDNNPFVGKRSRSCPSNHLASWSHFNVSNSSVLSKTMDGTV